MNADTGGLGGGVTEETMGWGEWGYRWVGGGVDGDSGGLGMG